MTRRVVLNLDLNENDFEALSLLLAQPQAVAQLVAPQNAREQARVIDVLCEMAGAIEEQGNYLDRQPEVS